MSSALPQRDHPDLGPDPIAAQLANTFSSDRLIYRALEDNDADIDLIWRIDANAQAAISSDPALPRPPTHQGVKTSAQSSIKDCLLAVVACLKPEAEPTAAENSAREKPAVTSGSGGPIPIGVLRVSPMFGALGIHHRRGQISINISEEYQSKGYGTEVMAWVLDWAFEAANLHSMSLSCSSFNTKALRVYEKIGFIREGTAREALWAAGRWWNAITFGILEQEWRADRERVWREVVKREGKRA